VSEQDKKFKIAIVGSGPSGLSAAAHAGALGMSHILLERTDHLADTIYKFQKGKPVMSTPVDLPVRADIPFDDGKREQVLADWADAALQAGANVRYNAEVTEITGQRGDFQLVLADGDTIEAETVVLACGLQGNLNKLRCPGAEWPKVQYQLDDPDEYEHERIVVIGGGDAGIENALALSSHNTVFMLNRGDEFALAKPPNEAAIMSLIDKGVIFALFNAETKAIEPGAIIVEMPDGEQRVECDRIIARIGAAPPRKFVENCGVVFPNDDRTALPEVSGHYESNIPGLYVIGALGGYPLIKQGVNQGYEVIEFIAGNLDLPPADQGKLIEKLSSVPDWAVDEFLETLRERIPIFNELNPLLLRESILEGTVHRAHPGDVIFERNDYSNSVYMVFEGSVRILINDVKGEEDPILVQGAFFGELGLLSGRRRSATAAAETSTVLLELPRRTMLRLRSSSPTLKLAMNREAVVRQLQAHLLPQIDQSIVRELARDTKVMKFAKGELLFAEGDDGDCVHLIIRGSVAMQGTVNGREVTLSYQSAGNCIGETALLTEEPRKMSARAVVECKTIYLSKENFDRIINSHPSVRAEMESLHRQRSVDRIQANPDHSPSTVTEFLLDQGLGEGTDILLIDEMICVGCDNCTTACASTHNGVPHLDRDAGASFANLHVPTSCRHCEHPHCMTDCPPDAIGRAESGEVFIRDSCIGCGNCRQNCPYGVIQMAVPQEQSGSFLMNLLFGPKEVTSNEGDRKRAVKCDMCISLAGGPACVRSCPTGAAKRVSPQEFIHAAIHRSKG
jgi:CRP-like cAMP-binding protein/thioredoxin reductase/Fe-S-cluster-containing hydrogenase component 2